MLKTMFRDSLLPCIKHHGHPFTTNLLSRYLEKSLWPWKCWQDICTKTWHALKNLVRANTKEAPDPNSNLRPGIRLMWKEVRKEFWRPEEPSRPWWMLMVEPYSHGQVWASRDKKSTREIPSLKSGKDKDLGWCRVWNQSGCRSQYGSESRLRCSLISQEPGVAGPRSAGGWRGAQHAGDGEEAQVGACYV